MITRIRMSAPSPKSMPWPTPHRPAQAAPVRRESVPAGGDVTRGNGGLWGITPGGNLGPWLVGGVLWAGPPGSFVPFAGGDRGGGVLKGEGTLWE